MFSMMSGPQISIDSFNLKEIGVAHSLNERYMTTHVTLIQIRWHKNTWVLSGDWTSAASRKVVVSWNAMENGVSVGSIEAGL